MQITLITVGKLKSGPLKDLCEEYLKRLNWQVLIVEIDHKSKLEGDALKSYEAQEIQKHIPLPSYVIAMDERGGNVSSPELADLLGDIQNHHHGKLTLIIGGADGLAPEIRKLSHKIISMGRLTWPHMLARVMLLEQLYRAQQILKGHPYHRV